MNDVTRKWLATRPPAVQALAAQYPPGSGLTVLGRPAWVIGYAEMTDGAIWLQCSRRDPASAAATALRSRFLVCPCCLSEEHPA